MRVAVIAVVDCNFPAVEVRGISYYHRELFLFFAAVLLRRTRTRFFFFERKWAHQSICME